MTLYLVFPNSKPTSHSIKAKASRYFYLYKESDTRTNIHTLENLLMVNVGLTELANRFISYTTGYENNSPSKMCNTP